MLSRNETKILSTLNHVLSFHTEEVRCLGQGAVPRHLPSVTWTIPTSERCTLGVFETKVLQKRKIGIYCLPRLQRRGLSGATLRIFQPCTLGGFLKACPNTSGGLLLSWSIFKLKKSVVLNPERSALLYHVCIANPLTEQEVRVREMPRCHRLDVLFSCLENKIPLVYKLSTGQL